MVDFGSDFIKVGHLYRFYGLDLYGILFYALWTTRAERVARVHPDFDDSNALGGGFDFGWDVSFLLDDHELYMFFRNEDTMLLTIEKIGSKQPMEMV